MTGEVIADRFELGRKVGEGGMGVVFAATDRVTGDTVALKILRTGGEAPDASEVARFEREASLLAQLEHPGIVRYVAHGTSDGKIWLAMEWLEGQTLDDRLRRQPLTLTESVDVIRQVAEALAAAHARGVVHRDLKPANLYLMDSDPANVRVLDFGVARAVGGAALTSTGVAIGTPQYMSPEQARAEQGVDARTDVYALGAVLYECLTGHRPFDGDTPVAVLVKILLEDPPPVVAHVPETPPKLVSLIDRMLAKDPAERPADGADLAKAIADLGPVEPITQVAPRAPALGDREQRLLCVVLVADVGLHGASAPTVMGVDSLSTDLNGELKELTHAHGGKVEFLADGSMVASLGGRGVATDHAERAARLALAIRGVLTEAPIAVVAGRSVMTERLPAGDVIDRGVKAIEVAPNAIDGVRPVRVDDLVHDLLGEGFVRKGPAGMRLLLRAEDAGATLQDANALRLHRSTPCVGRRRELGSLRAIADEVAEEPVARAVIVSAPAGGGKTRIVHELLGRLDEDDATILFGRADPMTSSPLAALAPAVLGAAGTNDAEPLETRRQKLAARVNAVVDEDADRVTRFLGELVRAPFPAGEHPALDSARRDPQLMGDAMRNALADWLRGETAQRPVILVLEDLQWADAPSIDAIDACLRRLEEEPLMVLATGRPELEKAFPNLWADREPIEIRLARLTRKAATKLVKALWAEADAETIDRIVERADGNAFFLEELVRALRRDADAELPESILGMVEARLGELDPGARRVLRAASVFGPRFWSGGVEHLLGARGVSAERWLELFAEDELISEASARAFAGEREWRFRQGLVQDAAYATLTDEDRQLGHELAAEWLENHGESDAAVLAAHLERGGDPVGAAPRYADAADRALEAGDFAQVLTLAERALSVADELSPALVGRLRLHQAEAHRWRADYGAAGEHADLALAHLPAGAAAWFQAIGNRVVASGVARDMDAVGLWAERALETQGTNDEAERLRLVALCRAAHQYLGAGDLDAADRLIAAVVAIAERVGGSDPWTTAWVETTRAARSLHAGAIGDYLEGTSAAVRAYDRAGDLRHACNQRVRLGYGFVEVGALERAETELRAALAAAETLGVPLVEGFALQNLGWVRALRGDPDEGRALEERVRALGRELSNAALEGGAHYYLARIARRVGDAEGALAQAKAALALFEPIPPLRTLTLAVMARALKLAGQHDEALARAREAIEARDTLASMEEGEALLWLAYLEVLPLDDDARKGAETQGRDALERRLAKLSTDLRKSYLAVPEHAALRALVSATP